MKLSAELEFYAGCRFYIDSLIINKILKNTAAEKMLSAAGGISVAYDYSYPA
ncbi:hypothetical protein [Metabacillus idriensis]|uniref:hypothetical protein n=1 Tax=Metabacillus idriensis TaxID=324768 RepID=UPI0016398F71|nr:hypothetical protein [Metabacillus idriensis]QNG61718.1 hypothetical protein H4O14_09755 [Bacillus sp. PAMC26568]